MKVKDIYELFNTIAPFDNQAEWDNSGLIVGDMEAEVKKIVVALDATEDIVEQAINAKADLLITHHPLVFSPMLKINSENFISNRVLKLAQNKVNYIAMHTNIDKTTLSEVTDELLMIKKERAIEVDINCENEMMGFGTIGKFVNQEGKEVNITLREAVIKSKNAFQREVVTVYGNLDDIVTKVGVCTGAGRSMIDECIKEKCDLLITGDITYHAALDALAQGLSIIDASHFGTEIIFIDIVSTFINLNLPDIKVIAGMQSDIGTFM